MRAQTRWAGQIELRCDPRCKLFYKVTITYVLKQEKLMNIPKDVQKHSFHFLDNFPCTLAAAGPRIGPGVRSLGWRRELVK